MKKLHFTYDMTIEYSVVVNRCNFTIKCFPSDTARQRIIGTNISLYPETNYSWGIDGLGNSQIYGVNSKPHNSFNFHIEGNAITGLNDYEELVDDNYGMIYRHPHGLNMAGGKLYSYFNNLCFEKNITEYEKVLYIMNHLYNDFHYEKNVTNIDTSAEEAFSLGAGVCQDYAHIFIALMHFCKIPARYVTGLIIGEGASHAWVEVLINGKWYGFDPTNNAVVTDNHIRIGVGRDAKDCTINRGIMHGGGMHEQTISVSVYEQ